MHADRTARLEVRDLHKRYGKTIANDGLSLRLEGGEVFGLLGPNGAGKTTLVAQVMGLAAPDAGAIRIEGVDVVADPAAARRLCSYLPQEGIPIDGLPLRSAIELVGRLRGGDPAGVRRRAARLLASLELEPWQDRLGHQVSGGVKRLVGFVLSAVEPGRVVILDEPTNDVDPLRRRLLWQEIRALAARGSAVLLVTHNVLEAERSVDRLAVVDEGRIRAEGTPAALAAGARGALRLDLTLEPRAEAPPLPPFAERRTQSGRRLLLHVGEDDAPHALEWARARVRDRIAESYELGPTTLEDAYLRIIGRADALAVEENADALARR